MAQLIHYHYTDSFHYSDIKAMDSSGILFVNGLSIFFEECAKNFARSYPEERGTCIAECSASADPPYFEFFTCGKSMVLLFDGLGRDTQQTFRLFRQRLENYGYIAYSLS
ncbi:MAG: hypothetical protein K6F80_04620 [Oscillospiraceae bacterium]|nr:hypothetical protein [Oscillospiraceae bacterium]